MTSDYLLAARSYSRGFLLVRFILPAFSSRSRQLAMAPGERLIPRADDAGGGGQLFPVPFHVAEHEAVQRAGAQPLAPVSVGGLRAGRNRFRRRPFRFRRNAF